MSKLSWLSLLDDNHKWISPDPAYASANTFGYSQRDFSPLAQLAKLRHIRLEVTRAQRGNYLQPERLADDDSLIAICARLPNLESVEFEFHGTGDRDAILRQMARLVKVKKLTLKVWEMELKNLRGLVSLPNLRELVICSPMQNLTIDEEWSELVELAPHLLFRRERVERYEWPAAGDETGSKGDSP